MLDGSADVSRRAIDERTKGVFLELIGNPRLDVHDLVPAQRAHQKRQRLAEAGQR